LGRALLAALPEERRPDAHRALRSPPAVVGGDPCAHRRRLRGLPRRQRRPRRLRELQYRVREPGERREHRADLDGPRRAGRPGDELGHAQARRHAGLVRRAVPGDVLRLAHAARRPVPLAGHARRDPHLDHERRAERLPVTVAIAPRAEGALSAPPLVCDGAACPAAAFRFSWPPRSRSRRAPLGSRRGAALPRRSPTTSRPFSRNRATSTGASRRATWPITTMPSKTT